MTKKWGKYIWFFFHSLAENIDDKTFEKNKIYLCNLIKNICSVLPCKNCSDHAKKYTKTLNHNTINTKSKFKSYLFEFHNNVNKRLNKKHFDNISIYKNSNFTKIYSCFIYYFQNSNYIYDNFSDKLIRNKIVENLNIFLNNNKENIKYLN
jgi:FAD-linked sulfhydryl oxidase